MGCWNGSCMLSGMPILAGEKFKLVILRAGHLKSHLGISGFCYASDFMRPAYLPISGKYDDYGGITDIKKDWNYEVTEKSLKKKFGDRLRLDIYRETTDWDLEKLLNDGIERQYPEYWGKADDDSDVEGWQPIKLSWVMIRQDVWDGCLKNYRGTGDCPWEGMSDAWKAFVARKEKYANQLEEAKAKALAALSDASFIDDLTEYQERLEFLNDCASMVHGEVFGFNLMDPDAYNLYCFENIRNETIMKDVEKQWLELYIMEYVVTNLRMGWMIRSGRGSQHNNFLNVLNFNEMVNDIARKKHKRHGNN